MHPNNDNNGLPSPEDTANGDAVIKNDTNESLGNQDNGEDRADQLMEESGMTKIPVYGHEAGRGQEDDGSKQNAELEISLQLSVQVILG